MCTQFQSSSSPGVEVGSSIDISTNTMFLADRPVLLEGGGPLDGGRIGTSAHVDVIGSSITLDRTLQFAVTGWVIGAKGFDNVVFNERVGGPAINSEVAVPLGVVITRV